MKIIDIIALKNKQDKELYWLEYFKNMDQKKINRKYDRKIEKLEIDRKKELDSKEKSYTEECANVIEMHACDCNHDIIIKLYGSHYALDSKEANYICLGCQKDLSYKENVEEIDSSKIIDFTPNNEITSHVLKYNSLVAYLQMLAEEVQKRLPNYTDEDFINMINDNIMYIKVPKNFDVLKYKDINN